MTKWPKYALLASTALLMVWPFLWMIGTSFKGLAEATTPSLSPWPREWHPENYIQAFQAAPFARYFLNSLAVSITIAGLVSLTAIMAGYALARLRFPGKRILFGAILATMMIPFEATLIPNFVLIGKLGWYNTYWALVVPWCANAFSIFLMRQAFLGLPEDYFDAARVDGCGHLRFLARIAAPLAKPAVVTVALFAFLGGYNGLLWPLVVTTDESMRVVQVGLTVFAGDAGVRVNLLMCASAIVILPAAAVYFAAQRQVQEGALGAGIKA